ncbi:FMN-binding glutamate synthase family protein [Corynebacterium heidelbergense]|uniref:FMN-binding glutamate synthase family protein n=1 Tax=Corynebacterium heidelbergense TaxID=2055947 RepID=A0A364V899_9CORY|nr:FMN-binding glutamate synthase family protein [Corynebacterium heidelbergense]RAV32847.1 FMN-binding glutamate synthase family protein [Corynebacterium heidelbergense]
MKLVTTAAAAAAAATAGLAARDLTQKRHAILRNYPVAGHLRFFAETIRPEIQQYFIEHDDDGRPFDRNTRSMIYRRAKKDSSEAAFGTERDIESFGYESLVHSAHPLNGLSLPFRAHIGGPDCTQPYDISRFNISAMSFGALSANAVRAMNKGAAMGGFAQDTGEGGLTKYHLEYGADLIWELGSGYFSSRTKDGRLDRGLFKEKAQMDNVKMVAIKLSQGAKPGIGGVLPAAKITAEIADIRGVPRGEDCVSPAAHKEFSTPIEFIEFLAELRELSGGKPVGFKLCVGARTDILSICKAILEVGTAPDFITVDGAEGGTGAAPVEFEDHVGMRLTDGLMTVHNALVGTGLRDDIAIGAAGKIAGGNDIVRRMIQGADMTFAARPMMMAAGCIQAQKCNTGKCPVGVATQSEWRQRAIDVDEKAERVRNYHAGTVKEAERLMAAMGVEHPSDLSPHLLRKVISATETKTYAELYPWLKEGELLDNPTGTWGDYWNHASAQTFRPGTPDARPRR